MRTQVQTEQAKRKDQCQLWLVSLTKSLVGMKVLRELKPEIAKGKEGKARVLFCFLQPQLVGKVKEMNPGTLGSICALAFNEGIYHFGLPEHGSDLHPKFIAKTGYKDVLRHCDIEVAGKDGLEILQRLALATIIATAHDILMQEVWILEWLDQDIMDPE